MGTLIEWKQEFENLVTDEEVLEKFRTNKYFPLLRGNPEAVYIPEKKKDILKLIKFAQKKKIPLIPVSSLFDFHGSTIPLQGGIIVDLRKLKEIEKVRECFNGMSADIEPGVTFKELNEKLSSLNMRALLPLRMPAEHSALSTYYGRNPLLEANKYGYHQDWMILTYQLAISKGHFIGMGSEGLETGGEPGDYPYSPRADLGRMFLGALGAFGIITRVSAKLKFKPARYEFLYATQDDLNSLVPKFRDITRFTDAAQTALIADPKVLSSYLAKSQQNYSNFKEKLPNWTGILAIAGDDDYINVEKADLFDKASRVGLHLTEDPPISNISEILRSEFQNAENVGKSFDFAPHLRIEFYTTAGRLPKIMAKMNEFYKHAKVEDQNIGFLINSLEMGRSFFCEYDLYYEAPPERIDPASLPNSGNLSLRELYDQSYKTLIESNAIINVPRNSIVARLVYPQIQEYYEMMRVLKFCVDPTNIMHPSMLFSGEGGIEPKTLQIPKEVSE